MSTIMPVFSWSTFKSLVVSKEVRPQYYETNTNYEVFFDEGNYVWSIGLLKGDSDCMDFETNYKSSWNLPVSSRDSDGANIFRNKAAKKGWSYAIIPIEFETSRRQTSTTFYSKLADGTDRSDITLKCYDANDAEVTTDGALDVNWATIVKTVIEFEPTYDYEVIGGYIRTLNDITSDIRLWIIAVPDIAAPSGSKEMVGGLNLNFLKPENSFNVDGRVSKYLTYSSTYHTNKLRFIFKYPAGTHESIVINIEHYRP